MTLSCFKANLPLPLIEWLITQAKERLTPMPTTADDLAGKPTGRLSPNTGHRRIIVAIETARQRHPALFQQPRSFSLPVR
jgi:hypothetical protein